MEAGLYIVGTPIGNLGDITLRALETLKAVNMVIAEDTRHTRKLLEHYNIHTPLMSCHKFNEAARVDFVINKIQSGSALALVTDSGMPAISDPGSRLVDSCYKSDLPVRVVPGPSAVTAAFSLCGFKEKNFLFEGFLPHKSGARRRILEALAALSQPIVLFESPYRLNKLLDEIDTILGDRTIFVGRELTKHFEETRRGNAREIKSLFEGRTVKGELVIIIGPASKEEKRGGIGHTQGESL